MRHPKIAIAGLLAAATLTAAACGGGAGGTTSSPTASTAGSPASPASTSSPALATPIRFTAGTAHVVVTGTVNETFDATILSSKENDTYDPDQNKLELGWEGADGRLLRVDLTPHGVGPAEDDFVAVGVPGSSIDDATYFFDPFTTICQTTLTRFDSGGVAGTFNCPGLQNNTDPVQKVNATGTFTATP